MSLKSFLQGLGILAVALTLFPFVAADYWWIRMFDFPHVQLTVFTLVALLVYFIRFDIRSWRDYAFIFILAGCFIFQMGKIYPYTPLAATQAGKNMRVHPERTISLLVANVLQKNKAHKKVLDVILTEDPDLVILTETNARWKRVLSPSLKDFGYRYNIGIPLDNTYGMLLFSKLKLLQPRVEFLLNDSIPSIHTRVRLKSRDLVELHVIHPTPPMPPHNGSSTARDAQMMLVAKMARKSDVPVIVAGDFNDVAWSESTSLFQQVSELLDPRIGRGFYNTFNANSWIMRWPLDHLFVSEEFRVMDLQLGSDIDSDHFPLYAKLSLEPGNSGNQQVPEPTSEELKQAEEQVKNQAEKQREKKSS